MKNIMLISILCAIWSTTSQAGTYESQLGFSIELSSHWTIINIDTLKKNPTKFHNIHDNKSESIKKAILEGKAEFYENLVTSDSSYRDNIYVFMSHDENPQKYKSFEKTYCEMIHNTYSKAFGRDVKVYGCKIDQVSYYDVIYTETDGALEGTRAIQYQIWKPSDDIIIMTLNCKNRNLSKLRKEFADIVKSFKVSK